MRQYTGRGIFDGMENPLPFLAGGLPDRVHGLQSITLTRVDGSAFALDPAVTRLQITEEHPDVDRMADDWGAICEVYKTSTNTYLTISGVALHAGDSLTMTYGEKPALTVRVIEVEAGRALVSLSGFSG